MKNIPRVAYIFMLVQVACYLSYGFFGKDICEITGLSDILVQVLLFIVPFIAYSFIAFCIVIGDEDERIRNMPEYDPITVPKHEDKDSMWTSKLVHHIRYPCGVMDGYVLLVLLMGDVASDFRPSNLIMGLMLGAPFIIGGIAILLVLFIYASSLRIRE